MEIQYTKQTAQKIDELGEWLGSGSLNAFGRPFAGKDTKLEPLSRVYNVPILSGGHILRNSTIPPEIKVIMESGALVPSDAYEAIVLPYLSQESFKNRPLLLSTVGRMWGEETGVMHATAAAGHVMKLVVDFKITREESYHRMENAPSRGRADDKMESRHKRLDFFDEHTIPVIDFYEAQGLLISVDAMPKTHIAFRNFINIAHDRTMGKG